MTVADGSAVDQQEGLRRDQESFPGDVWLDRRNQEEDDFSITQMTMSLRQRKDNASRPMLGRRSRFPRGSHPARTQCWQWHTATLQSEATCLFCSSPSSHHHLPYLPAVDGIGKTWTAEYTFEGEIIRMSSEWKALNSVRESGVDDAA